MVTIKAAIVQCRDNWLVSYDECGVKFLMHPDETILEHLSYVMNELYNLGTYSKFDFKDKIVADIGGFYGDTAIFFGKQAKKVYVFEPYKSCDYIPANCVINGVTNFIVFKTPVLVDGTMAFTDEWNTGGTRIRSDDASGEKMRTISLETVCRTIKNDSGIEKDYVLKMDCEGSEYVILEHSERETLRKFETMMIEYHDYPEKIESMLVDAGFYCTHEVVEGSRGMIYARRI